MSKLGWDLFLSQETRGSWKKKKKKKEWWLSPYLRAIKISSCAFLVFMLKSICEIHWTKIATEPLPLLKALYKETLPAQLNQ